MEIKFSEPTITLYSNEKQMEEMVILGVLVGIVDVRLMGVYDRLNAVVSDWQSYLLYQIEERTGFSVKTEQDVKAFLKYLEENNTTFSDWMHGWMKNELKQEEVEINLSMNNGMVASIVLIFVIIKDCAYAFFGDLYGLNTTLGMLMLGLFFIIQKMNLSTKIDKKEKWLV